MVSSGSTGSFLALFSVRDPLCPFAIPVDLFIDPTLIWKREVDIGCLFNLKLHETFGDTAAESEMDLEPLKLFSKDLKLAIQFLAGASQRRMTKWSQVKIIYQLLSLIKACSGLNLDIFRLHFG